VKSKATIAFLAVMILISSNSCLDVSHFVIITNQPPNAIQLDPFDLEDIEIDCFSLCMSPAAFLESYPVQANLYLRHNSNGDACEALVNESVSFNLRPIAELYKTAYGKYDEIILNVYEYKSINKMSVSYFPD